MWSCTNCHHIELTNDRPEHYPVCSAGAEKLEPYEIAGTKGTKTLKNLKAGFIAESQAHLGNLAFAMKADQEGYSQVARLFRAVAEAEAVHAFNQLRLLGAVSSTQENLESAFQRENLATSAYPQFIREANEEDNTGIATVFSYSRDVERGHARLYKKALAHMMAERESDYYVCQSVATSPMAFSLTSVPSAVPARRSSGGWSSQTNDGGQWITQTWEGATGSS